MFRPIINLAAGVLSALALAIPATAPLAHEDDGYRVAPACDSACLEDLVVRYMEAFVVRDPSRLPWAERVRFSENNVMLRIGDGSWNVADHEYDARLRYCQS